MTVAEILPPPGEFRTTEEIRDAKLAKRLARKRRALLLWSLPVVILAFLAVLKLLSAVAINMAGESAYEHQNHNTAADRFSTLEFFNVVEPWKAYFNQGTAIYASGSFFDATTEFDVALQLVPKAPEGEPPTREECDVRTNYSLAFEGLGDEAMVAGDPAMGSNYFTQAQEMLSTCGESGGTGGEEAQDAEERQQESQSEAEQQQEQEQEGGGGEDPSQNPSETPSDGESPSQDPSESGSGESPSQDPSQSGSGESPSQDPSESGSGGESQSPTESTDPRQQELEERNQEAQESRQAQEQESGGGNGDGQNW